MSFSGSIDFNVSSPSDTHNSPDDYSDSRKTPNILTNPLQSSSPKSLKGRVTVRAEQCHAEEDEPSKKQVKRQEPWVALYFQKNRYFVSKADLCKQEKADVVLLDQLAGSDKRAPIINLNKFNKFSLSEKEVLLFVKLLNQDEENILASVERISRLRCLALALSFGQLQVVNHILESIQQPESVEIFSLFLSEPRNFFKLTSEVIKNAALELSKYLISHGESKAFNILENRTDRQTSDIRHFLLATLNKNILLLDDLGFESFGSLVDKIGDFLPYLKKIRFHSSFETQGIEEFFRLCPENLEVIEILGEKATDELLDRVTYYCQAKQVTLIFDGSYLTFEGISYLNRLEDNVGVILPNFKEKIQKANPEQRERLKKMLIDQQRLFHFSLSEFFPELAESDSSCSDIELDGAYFKGKYNQVSDSDEDTVTEVDEENRDSPSTTDQSTGYVD